MEVRYSWLVLFALLSVADSCAQALHPYSALPSGTPTPALPPVDTGGARMLGAGLRASGASGAVGASQYVQLADGWMAIYRKQGGTLQLAASASAPYAGRARARGMRACSSHQAGSSSILYDHLAQRWIVAHKAQRGGYLCIAVSADADAAGSYSRYALPLHPHDLGRPALALWPDAVYVTFEHGPRACGIERRALARGAQVRMRCVHLGRPVAAASLQPHAAIGHDPAALLLALDVGQSGRGERLILWRYRFRQHALSRPIAIPVAPFSAACAQHGDGACISQPAGGSMLPAHGGQLAPGVAYSGQALLLNHAVTHADGQVGVRWYEIRQPHGAVQVYQQGTHAPDAAHRWMAAIGMDRAGNIALGYAVAAADTAPGIRYTGRLRSDPPGRMQQEEFIVNGSGVQSGDPMLPQPGGALALDPADGCTFWYTQQYVASSGSAAWRTHIASFKFRNCL